MQAKSIDSVIALAGITQAIFLAQEIARTGKIDDKIFEINVNSLFQINPPNAIAIYGNVTDLQYGLEKLISTLNTNSTGSYMITKHILSLMSLQKKIFRSQIVINILTQRLQQAKKQVDYFNLNHPTVIANLADIYIDVVSRFDFRFYLVGKKQVLEVKENMEKIRALLLTAIRACVLWQQLGGSRLQLIFGRKTIKSSALHLLNKLTL